MATVGGRSRVSGRTESPSMYQLAERVELPSESANEADGRAAGSSTGLAEIIALAWRAKWRIALCAIVGAAIVIGIGQLIPPRYVANAQILIDPSELRVLDNNLRSQSPFNEALIAEVETQTRVLLSSNVLARVVEREQLSKDAEFSENKPINPLDMLRAALRSLGVGNRDDGPPDASLTALRSLEKRVWARRGERTYVVDLGVGTQSREKSVRIADAIVDAFLEEQRNAQAEAASKATKMLGDRLDDLRRRAVEAEERVEAFKRANNIVSASGELVVEQQVSTINNQLVLARSRATEMRSRYDQINAIRASGGDISAITEATGSQTLAALRAQHGAAARREAELSAILLPKHPVVRQAREQLRKIAAEIGAEVNRIADAARREYERAQASEASLEHSLQQLKGDLTSTNDKLVQLRELERDASASRVVYEASLKRTQEVSEQVKLTLANTRVISRATPEEHRSLPPSKALLGIGGMGLGAMLGLGLALASPPASTGRPGGSRHKRKSAPV